MTRPILEAVNVSKIYTPSHHLFGGSGETITALEGVTCALKPGERLGLVGESGSGKTTLAKLLAGLTVPSSGTVRVHGEPRAAGRGRRLAWARAAQFVFQDPQGSLHPRLTVEEALSEPLLIHRLARGEAARRARVRMLLDMVELPAVYAGRLPRELSGGERQRVGIARALALEPEALICDEPIASLDVLVGARILELLRRLSEAQRMAILFVSHDLRAVAWLCETVVVLQRGRQVDAGPTRTLLASPRHPYTALLVRSAELDLDVVL